MYYVIMGTILVTSFFVVNGIGKIALNMYATGKLKRNAASIISISTLALWHIVLYIILTLTAFHINYWLGWVVAVFWGISTIVVGFGELKKDNDHTMALADERRQRNLQLGKG